MPQTRDQQSKQTKAGALAVELSGYKRDLENRKALIHDIFALLFSDPGPEIDTDKYPAFRDMVADLNAFHRGTKCVRDNVDMVRGDFDKLELLIE